MPYAIDTAATIADLESAGVEPGQARAIVHAINGAVGDPVSKEDFRELRGEFKSLDGKFTKLRDEMDRRFAELRDEMDRKFGTRWTASSRSSGKKWTASSPPRPTSPC